MLKATKVRIYPTPEQAEFLNAQFGAVRFAFNRGLAIQSYSAKIHRELSGIVKSITLSKTTHGKHYASILVEDGLEQPKPLQTIQSAVGLDLGLTDFYTDSNGHIVSNPRYLRSAEKNLKRKQRQLSRKQKGSANRAKARKVLANAHEKLKNIRNDFQHKRSRTLVDENQAVMVETLKSANMMKNKHLAKAIGDVAWNSFISKLEYKAKAKGHHLLKLSQWFAGSKTCSNCGYKMEELPLNIREWSCPSCSTRHQRDINAAINHLKQGMIELKAAGRSFSLAESVSSNH